MKTYPLFLLAARKEIYPTSRDGRKYVLLMQNTLAAQSFVEVLTIALIARTRVIHVNIQLWI